MSRLFAFGCSYTRYAYATWADFVGVNFNEYRNYGRGGASNNYILSKFIEAYTRHNINSDDTVIVMFTGFGRMSYIPKNSEGHLNWVTNGDFYEYYRNTKDKHIKDFLEYMYSDNWATEFAYQSVKTIKEILTLKGIKHKFLMSIDNSHYLDNEGSKWGRVDRLADESVRKTNEIYQLLDIKESLDQFKEIYSRDDYYVWKLENNRFDGHPTQRMHYDFVKQHLPEYLTDKAVEAFETVEKLFMGDSQSNQSTRFYNEYQYKILKDL